MSTPSELMLIADKVLAWVAWKRKVTDELAGYMDVIPADDLRRIELCALATREACMLHMMYPHPFNHPLLPEDNHDSL